jgi:hypothetical protein
MAAAGAAAAVAQLARALVGLWGACCTADTMLHLLQLVRLSLCLVQGLPQQQQQQEQEQLQTHQQGSMQMLRCTGCIVQLLWRC